MARYDLHIKSVSDQDEGLYTCVDKAGIGDSASATLSVLPRVTTQRRRTIRLFQTTSSMTGHSLSTSQHKGTHKAQSHTRVYSKQYAN